MKKLTLFSIIIPLLFVSCENSHSPIKPNATGKPGEILIICSEKLWKTNIGDTIFDDLSTPFKILPQDEPFFNVINIPKTAFKNIFKTHRNIIFINIEQKNKTEKITITKNKWADNQLIYTLYAQNDSTFFEIWNKNIEKIKTTYFNKELKRYQNVFKKYINTNVKKQLAEKYKINLDITTDYNLDVAKEHFCWISRETDISSQGILIYDYPYTDSSTFTTEFIVKKRDQITKNNVPGPENGTYMQTEKKIPIKSTQTKLNGNYCYEIRGLWYTENYFLGGPFINISVLDQTRNRIVTIEAYVYAGKQYKKLYLWQTEAIIKTLTFIK